MEPHTLILTPWITVHQIVPWQTAIGMAVTGKINVLEEYDVLIPTVRTTYFQPAVGQLRKHMHAYKKGAKFSRVNVFTRDGFRCQYCGAQKPMSQLNYDHVIPRDQGGRTNWMNIVTSCYPCNGKKRNRTPGQAGMTLLKPPFEPKTLPLTAPVWARDKVPPEWLPYLNTQSSGWAFLEPVAPDPAGSARKRVALCA
jgi:5-methylcytosine-specific restriction endonuclease McrA